MPRTARRPSATGIYAVLLTCTDACPLFREDEDRAKFLSVLRQCRALCGCEIFAYCLADDRIHLLIKQGSEPLSGFFKRLGGRYVYWYNLKYHRSGPLFRGRYRSEPVEDESAFLALLHHIHRLPVLLGLESSPDAYPWSSYAGWPDGITETAFAIELTGGREELMRFFAQSETGPVPEEPSQKKACVTDEEGMQLLAEVTGCGSEAEFRSLQRSVREVFLRALYRRGLSLRQLARISGQSRSAVYRVVRYFK